MQPDQCSSVLQDLGLQGTFLYCRLLSAIKNDIVLAQPQEQSREDNPPKILPPSVVRFIEDALRLEKNKGQAIWDVLKDDVWGMSGLEMLNSQDFALFKQFGWDRGLTAYTLYPPGNYCINTECTNTCVLKKAKPRRVVLYTFERGVQPAWVVTLYCAACKSTYHNNFVARDKERTYYHGVPRYIEVGEHQYVEDRVVKMWANHMATAWVSATNLGKLYDMSFANLDYLNDSEWQFVPRLSTVHVWDAFIIFSLLDDKRRSHQQLRTSDEGLQADRFTKAMKERNAFIIHNGQPDAVHHACDKCMRIYEKDGETFQCQAVVGDGVSMGRPCCGVFGCTEDLQNNRHRFCETHFGKHQECAIKGCKAPVASEGSKTCSDKEHQEVEKKNKEKGSSIFLFKERSKKWQSPDNTTSNRADDHNDLEWYEVNERGNVRMELRENPGNVGVADDSIEPEKCPEKPATGNRVFKAQFGRRITSDEQSLVWGCGMIYNRSTQYGTEAVSNFLRFVENAFSVPGARKPEHIFYDSNCLARQQAEGNKWFEGVGMYVDVWHFKNKHKESHEYCQRFCNPINAPELLDDDGNWYFNTSVAEQHNAWLGKYLPICREMLPYKYDFFLDEMIRLRNVETLKRLTKKGYNVRTTAHV